MTLTLLFANNWFFVNIFNCDKNKNAFSLRLMCVVFICYDRHNNDIVQHKVM